MISSDRSRERAALRVCALALLAGCGCSASTTHDDADGGGSGSSSAGSPGGAGALGLGGSLGTHPGRPRCTDGSLRCRKVDCPADSSPSTTSVTGVGLAVYAERHRTPEGARAGGGAITRMVGRLRTVFKEFF